MARTLVFVTLAVLGCHVASRESSPRSSIRDTTHDERLLEIAAIYPDYGRVDDLNRWVPTDCLFWPGEGRLSDAAASTPHGGKLFFAYAKDRASYVDPDRDRSPIGQVIVKEAWKPEKVIEGVTVVEFSAQVSLAIGPDGQVYRPKEKSGLFIMMKVDPAAHPEADDGWIYATIDPNGTDIIQSGKIDSCMSCHRKNPDRLFGLDL